MEFLMVFALGAGVGVALFRLSQKLGIEERIEPSERITRVPGKWNGGER
mgnify:CR=1 FL=1